MKVAVVGSRNISTVDLDAFLPISTTEIVSGAARGVDACARRYARAHHIQLTEFFPDYDTYGRTAPLRRNDEIVNYADLVLAFWDGASRGTQYVIRRCREEGKPVRIFRLRKPVAEVPVQLVWDVEL